VTHTRFDSPSKPTQKETAMPDPTPAQQRRWHTAFVAILGGRLAARMNDRDEDYMRDMRASGVTAITAARVIRERIETRYGVAK